MKILFIIPGSGDSFYCGNCFRDNLLASSLRKAGHEVTIMPLYLPLKQKAFQADTPLFFPATTYYTAHKFFGDKKMPGWLRSLTGSDAMLNIASSLSGTTSAEGMEGMTLSMITGDDPAFSEHASQLADWLRKDGKHDIIHLSSPLLAGIAKFLRSRLSARIVCSVQDEEIWIDSLDETHAGVAWQGIAESIRHIDRFITSSHFYRETARRRIPRMADMEVIYPGVDRGKYDSPGYPEHPVIGFFYRMNRLNGLDILAEAYVRLKERGSIPNLRLKIGGGYSGKDKSFLKKVKKILAPYKEEVELCSSYSLEEHARFYSSISVISVPLTFEEGVGLYICEAFAAGRPAVVPATGSFPEIVGEAGVLYQPNDSEALADALQQLLTDDALYARTARKARELSAARYDENILAQRLIQVYSAIG